MVSAVNPGGCLTSRADCVVHEDTICQSQDLPGVPGADEETRTHRGRIPALEVHRVQPDHHGTTGRLSGPDRAGGPGWSEWFFSDSGDPVFWRRDRMGLCRE